MKKKWYRNNKLSKENLGKNNTNSYYKCYNSKSKKKKN